MKKFIVLALGLALTACEQAPQGSTVAQLDGSNQLHTVCLDGVEYWFREGNNAVLAPRMQGDRLGTQAHVVKCDVSTETNDAAIVGVVSQM